MGIVGHCTGEAYVFKTPQELGEFLENKEKTGKKPVILVAQTTFNAKIFEECKKKFKKSIYKCKNF